MADIFVQVSFSIIVLFLKTLALYFDLFLKVDKIVWTLGLLNSLNKRIYATFNEVTSTQNIGLFEYPINSTDLDVSTLLLRV